MEMVVTYCRACGGEDRPHSVVPCDYVTNCDMLQCRECGTEKTVPRKQPEVSEMVDRTRLVRSFLYWASIHNDLADKYLHSDELEYSGMPSHCREDLARISIRSGREYLRLAEDIRTGHFDYSPQSIEVPDAVTLHLEFFRRDNECRNM